MASAFSSPPGSGACRRPRGPRSSPPEVCPAHPARWDPALSLRAAPIPLRVRPAGPDPRGRACVSAGSGERGGAGGRGHARAAHSTQTGKLRPGGHAVSSRGPWVWPTKPHPAGSPRALRVCWAAGLGRGRAGPPDPRVGVIEVQQLQELGGNRKQAEGPAGTLSTLLTCQRRAGPPRPGGGAQDL